MSQILDVSGEFQKRRQTTRRLEMPWIGLMMLGWLGAYVAFFVESLPAYTSTSLFVLSIVILGVSIVRMNFIAMKHYRCPACGRMPIVNGMQGGLLIDPEECPNCGASFR
jgi:predicted RNA-binding Zn-ribbon protein involved in translation (DUF1610 family)